MALVLNRTKIGLLIRAGVENQEMVEALGYRIRRLFVGVFVAGSALAGLGGVMWALYRETLTAGIGSRRDRAGVHRHHHRRARLGRRLLPRRDPRGDDGELHRLRGAEGRARLQHPLMVADPVVAAARPLSSRKAINAMLKGLLSDDFPRSPVAHRGAAGDPDRAGAGAVPVRRRAGDQHGGKDLRVHRAGRELRPAARLHRHRLVRAHDVLRHRRLWRRPRALQLGSELACDRRRASSSRWWSACCWRSSSASSRCACGRSSTR